MAGFADLGNILGGGIDRQGAYLEGRYRSAQTESALAQARKNQADALAQEKINIIKEDLLTNAPDFNNPHDTDLASLIVGGMGSDYNSAMSGRKTGHDLGLKQEIAAPGTSYDTINRNRAALGETPFDPINAVGTRGAFTDARSPDQAVQPPLGEDLFPGDPTSAEQNYERYIREGGKPGPEVFGRFARPDQIISGGGVNYTRGVGGNIEQPVDTATVASNAGEIAEEKKLGQGMAGRKLDLPMAKTKLHASKAKFGRTSEIAQTLQADEDLWAAVGLGQPISQIPGTEGARVRAKIANLKARLRLDTLQDLRDNSKTGGAVGNVSNYEQNILADYIESLDADLAPEDFREALQNVIDHFDGLGERIEMAFYETYPEMREQQTAPGAAPNAAAPAQVPTFATEAEAEAAGLAPGTRVIIGGQSGTWQ